MSTETGRVRVEGIGITYGAYPAVRDVSFEVPSGQFVAIVGPTGCGKSSLLSVVAGLQAPAEGRVLVSGTPVTSVNRECAYMFQSDALLPWKTARQNVELGPV